MVQQAQSCKNQLDHMYQWHEFQNGEAVSVLSYDSTMLDMAKTAELCAEQLAGVAGQLKARKKS